MALLTRGDVGVGGLPVTTVRTATAAIVPKATNSVAISRIINFPMLLSKMETYITLLSIVTLQEDFYGAVRQEEDSLFAGLKQAA